MKAVTNVFEASLATVEWKNEEDMLSFSCCCLPYQMQVTIQWRSRGVRHIFFGKNLELIQHVR